MSSYFLYYIIYGYKANA